MNNIYKRRDRADYVFCTSDKGVITSTDGLAHSALVVSGGDPAEAIAFLERSGADRNDDIMGPVFTKLETMKNNLK